MTKTLKSKKPEILLMLEILSRQTKFRVYEASCSCDHREYHGSGESDGAHESNHVGGQSKGDVLFVHELSSFFVYWNVVVDRGQGACCLMSMSLEI